MSEYIYVGKIVNTHGIKGELRIISNFEYKEQVFKTDMHIYVDVAYEELIIDAYRSHKQFDMIKLRGFTNINEVLKYKNKNVYVKRDDLDIKDNYVFQDLLGYKLFENDICFGKVIEILHNGANVLLKIEGDNVFYVPLNDEFILNVDISNKKIEGKKIGSLVL